jgi:hypothetical protein
MGDPLTEAQTSMIERWIPPPVSEEPYVSNDIGSQSDSDNETELARRIEELAIKNETDGDHANAEQFYRSAIEHGEASSRPASVITAMRVRLAYACMRQKKWPDAEDIIVPIAFERKTNDILVYHSMHALAIASLGASQLDAAEKYCKRALWGKRKVLGKDHTSCWETLALLVSICTAKNKMVEAEAHRSFIPYDWPVKSDAEPLTYLDRSVGNSGTAVHSSIVGSSSQRSLTPQQQSVPSQQYPPRQPHLSYTTPVSSNTVPASSTFAYPKSVRSQYTGPSMTTSYGGYPPPPETWQSKPGSEPKVHIFVSVDYIQLGYEYTSVAYAIHRLNKPMLSELLTEWPGSPYSKLAVCYPLLRF